MANRNSNNFWPSLCSGYCFDCPFLVVIFPALRSQLKIPDSQRCLEHPLPLSLTLCSSHQYFSLKTLTTSTLPNSQSCLLSSKYKWEHKIISRKWSIMIKLTKFMHQPMQIYAIFLKYQSVWFPFLEIPEISEIQNKYTSQEVLLRCLISRIYYKTHIPRIIDISEMISTHKTKYSYTPDKLPITELPAFFPWPPYRMVS